jgi:hypothetical protein
MASDSYRVSAFPLRIGSLPDYELYLSWRTEETGMLSVSLAGRLLAPPPFDLDLAG